MSVWTWVYLDGASSVVQSGDPAPGFQCQADAESWVGETWRDLVSAGVDSVTLTHDGAVVYGPMSLRPAG